MPTSDLAGGSSDVVGSKRPLSSASLPERGTGGASSPSTIGDYSVEGKVGEGTYGRVYCASDQRSGATVAIKRLKSARDGVSHTAYREIALVRELRHPHIVRMLDVLLERDDDGGHTLNLVFEHVTTDLSQLIRANRSTGFEPRVVRKLMRQLLEGLGYLHGCSVMHRDIKPANLLVSSRDWKLKIGDFGLARLFDAPLRALHLDGPVVTVWYRAPELLLGAPSHTPAIDCWAAGCIFGELLCCKALFTASEAKGNELQEEQLRSIFRGLGMPTQAEWPGLPSLRHWPAVSQWKSHDYADTLEARLRGACVGAQPKPSVEMVTLLRSLLRFAPERRVSAEEALSYSFLAEGGLPEGVGSGARQGAEAVGGLESGESAIEGAAPAPGSPG